jgi:tetratricopeptide (TPR) repeat protein
VWQSRQRWILLGLAAVVVAIYAPVRGFAFVTFDDPEYITLNPYIARGLTWSGVWWAFTSGYMFYWHPLTWISHMLDIELFGMDAGMHHAASVLLHAANSMLLFVLLRRLTGAAWRSAFSAALFAVHPLRVESVAWVAERKDVLCGLFWMLTLLAYVSYSRAPGVRRYLWVAVLLAAALMSKPMAVTLPFVLLLLDYWPLNRIREGSKAELWRLVREKIPLFAMAVGAGIATYKIQHQVGAVAALDVLPVGVRVANALVSYVAYLGDTLWPAKLAALYPFQSLAVWEIAGAAAVLAAISAAVWFASRRYLTVGWLWFLGTLVPVIGLIQAGGQARADRFTYLPLIGIFAAGAWGIAELAEKRAVSRTVLSAAAGALLAAFSMASRVQLGYWSDSVSLWTRAISVTEGNFHAHNNLGYYLANQGRIAEAIPHFEEALRIRPDFPQAHSNLGAALAQQGRMAEAVEHYRAALKSDPNNADAHNNLGVALGNAGRTEEALHEFLEALRVHPDDANAHANAGVMLGDLGRRAEAIEQFHSALRLNPNHEQARRQLQEVMQRPAQ